MSSDLSLTLTLKAINEATRPIREVASSVNSLGSAINRVGRLSQVGSIVRGMATDLKSAAREASILGLKLAAIGGAATYLFNKEFVEVASQFEQYEVALETIEGSTKKAKKTFEWLNTFAVKTPYELDELTASFVKLKSYGIDPIANDTLRILGDTSSIIPNKKINDASEALADAVTGENERLKEFGINAQTVGKKIRYLFTDLKTGSQKVLEADKANRQAIQNTILAIFNHNYSGGMAKQADTFSGIISNIKDSWTNFKMMIMNAGVFEYLQSKAKFILDFLDELKDSGKMQEIATKAGKEIVGVLEMLWKAGSIGLDVMKKFGNVINWVAEKLGGYKNLLLVVGAIMAGGVTLSLLGIIAGIIKLGFVLGGVVVGLVQLVFWGTALTKFAMTLKKADMVKYFTGWKGSVKDLKNQWGLLNGKIKDAGGLKAFTKKTATLSNAKKAVSSLSVALRTGFVTAIRTAITSVGAFSAAVCATFGWVILAVAAVGLVAVAIYKYWKPLKAFFAGYWQGLLDGLAPVLKEFKSLWIAIDKELKPVFVSLKPVLDFVGAGCSLVGKHVSALCEIIGLMIQPMDEGTKEAHGFGYAIGTFVANAVKAVLAPIRFLIWLFVSLPKASFAAANGVKTGFSSVASSVQSIAQKIRSVMTRMANSMLSAGKKIVTQLVAGIKSKAMEPVNAVKSIASSIMKHFPQSPAKMGPLKNIPKIRIMEEVAKTIRPQPVMSKLNSSLSSVPSTAGSTLNGGTKGNTIINYNPTIHIGAGVGNKEEFLALLNQHKQEIVRLVEGTQKRNGRLSYS